MATVYTPILSPLNAEYMGSTFPQFKKTVGTNIPVSALFYDAATDEAAFWRIPIINYGSGNITVTVVWYADTATSGNVVWGAAIAAITPNTDTQDVETDALATENTATDSHLGTTGQRIHSVTITVSNLDSVAAGDDLVIRVRRLGSNGSDTMTGDAGLLYAYASYSDT